jgi:fermentation-respiration switch protein FrsA (DUF1100 family)
MVLSGERDTRTKPENAREVYDLLPGAKELWIVPGADHEDLMAVAQEEYRRRVGALVAAAR